MALITRLQWMLLRLGLSSAWSQLLFATGLLLLLLAFVLRQDGLNVLAKASRSAQLPDFSNAQSPSEPQWNTLYDTEALAQQAQAQATAHAQALLKPKRSNRHEAQTSTASGEALFLQTYQLLGDGQHAQALALAQTMTERFPHFQLGQLVYADLMASATGLPPQNDALSHNPDTQRRLNQLKTEALQRTRHAGPAQLAGQVPEPVRYLSANVPQMVLVDAQKSRLYLLAQRSDGTGKIQLQVVFDAYVSIGDQGMGKWRKGDAKTPAGVYFIQKHLTDPMLPDLYGSGALTLDYPNPLDKQLNRTGSGIWLHGSPSQQYARPPTATDGCVVLANDDMTRLVQHGMRADTPVIIAEQVRWVAPGPHNAAQTTAPTNWPQPQHTQQTPGQWTLVSAFEWTDQDRTVAVLSHELQAPGQAPQRHHSYWVQNQQQWQEVSRPL